MYLMFCMTPPLGRGVNSWCRQGVNLPCRLTHELDPRHKVVVTINPPDGTYQVATLDRALLDRMVMVYVETDYSCWARHAEKNSFDADVRQFLAAHSQMLARQGSPLDMQMEPSERAWEMVSTLRRNCRFPRDLEMEVYAGIVGNEAAALFLQWCTDNRARPVSADEVLDGWDEVEERVRAQRDDLQAATLNLLVARLRHQPRLSPAQERNLVAYIDVLPRDLRFGLVKTLLKIPAVAAVLSKDEYDAVVLDAIAQISREAS